LIREEYLHACKERKSEEKERIQIEEKQGEEEKEIIASAKKYFIS